MYPVDPIWPCGTVNPVNPMEPMDIVELVDHLTLIWNVLILIHIRFAQKFCQNSAIMVNYVLVFGQDERQKKKMSHCVQK